MNRLHFIQFLIELDLLSHFKFTLLYIVMFFINALCRSVVFYNDFRGWEFRNDIKMFAKVDHRVLLKLIAHSLRKIDNLSEITMSRQVQYTTPREHIAISTLRFNNGDTQKSTEDERFDRQTGIVYLESNFYLIICISSSFHGFRYPSITFV